MSHRGELALQALLEGLPDATVAARPDGAIVFVNQLAQELFGYTSAELLGRPISMLWPERMRERYERNMALYFELEHPLRFSERAYGVRSDGSEFMGEMSWGIVESSQGRCCWRWAGTSPSAWRTTAGSAASPTSRPSWPALGERALRGVAPADLAREAVERVGTALGATHVAILEPDADEQADPQAVAAWGAAEDPAARGRGRHARHGLARSRRRVGRLECRHTDK